MIAKEDSEPSQEFLQTNPKTNWFDVEYDLILTANFAIIGAPES
jgi:hypothetical protein